MNGMSREGVRGKEGENKSLNFEELLGVKSCDLDWERKAYT